MKKYLALFLATLLLAACATPETDSAPQSSSGKGKDCVRRTGSNLCS